MLSNYPPGVTGNEPEIAGEDMRYICEDCGKHFVHFVGGMPQKVCGVCDGVDSEVAED